MVELLGKLVAPFTLFAIVFSFLAAWVVDVTGDYRTIWLFPAAAGIVQAVTMLWLRVPKGHERAELDGLFDRMSESILTQVTGKGRSLWGGEVTAADADSASLFDMARNILGNPYEDPVDQSALASGDHDHNHDDDHNHDHDHHHDHDHDHNHDDAPAGDRATSEPADQSADHRPEITAEEPPASEQR
jgi:hypothetical protein